MILWRWITILCIGLNIVLLYQLFGGSLGLGQFNALKSNHDQLQAVLTATEQDNQRLSREILLLKNDPDSVAKVVRTEMHYLRPGEVMYLFTKD